MSGAPAFDVGPAVINRLHNFVRQNIGQYPILVVIDCKDYKEPLDVKDVEEFSGLVRDVRANKGALISSNDFSEAAINVARNHGIETFRLVDTESVVWKTYVAVPALLERTFMQGSQLSLSGTGRIVIPYDGEDLANLTLHSADGTSLGSAKSIVNTKWDNLEIPHEPGMHEVIVGKRLTVNFNDVISTVDVSATVMVGREYFLGPIPVSVRGLQDAQKGGILTRQLRTDMIDFALVQRGELPGWTKIDDPSELSVKVTFRLAYSNLYCDYPDEEHQPHTR